MYQKGFEVCDNYAEFIKQKNAVYAIIGKPNTKIIKNIVSIMEGEEQVINSYNRLINTINLKSKQFQEEQFNDFLSEQTRSLREGKEFELIKCQKNIRKINK